MKSDKAEPRTLREAWPAIVAGALIGIACFVAGRHISNPDQSDKLLAVAIMLGMAMLQLISMVFRLQRRLRAVEEKITGTTKDSAQ